MVSDIAFVTDGRGIWGLHEYLRIVVGESGFTGVRMARIYWWISWEH
jgi:hypothetical protein